MLIGAIIGIIIGTILNAILIFIVGRLKVGMEVDSFTPALQAGFLVALGGLLAAWVWSLTGGTPATGIQGAITNLIVSAGVLLAAGRAIAGMRVNGVGGALLAAVALAAVAWLINLVLAAGI